MVLLLLYMCMQDYGMKTGTRTTKNRKISHLEASTKSVYCFSIHLSKERLQHRSHTLEIVRSLQVCVAPVKAFERVLRLATPNPLSWIYLAVVSRQRRYCGYLVPHPLISHVLSDAEMEIQATRRDKASRVFGAQPPVPAVHSAFRPLDVDEAPVVPPHDEPG